MSARRASNGRQSAVAHPARAANDPVRPDDACAAESRPGSGAPEAGRRRHPAPDGEREPRSSRRLLSVDATRGWAIVILLLAGSPFQRQDLLAQLKHPAWDGLRFADLFFPLFLFVMGVSMTLSRRLGSPRLVLRRVALLFLVGIVLSSLKHDRLFVTGVLQHIAGAYLLAWLVLRAPRRIQPLIALAILGGVWIGFLLWAGGERDPWGPQETLAHAVDRWLLGGFATEGVVQTVISTVTVLAGVIIGRGMQQRADDPHHSLRWVAAQALWLVAVALLMALVVPINKRLWTPSFTVLTVATSCAWLALFIWLVDIRRHRRWTMPLQELGANPIAVYVGFMTVKGVVGGFTAPTLAPLGSEVAGAMAYALMWLLLGWLFAHWLYRRRLFLKI